MLFISLSSNSSYIIDDLLDKKNKSLKTQKNDLKRSRFKIVSLSNLWLNIKFEQQKYINELKIS